MDEPTFSIISATYNCKAKLEATVKSVLSQSFRDLEYLFMDGNSKDGTQAMLAAINDPRVKIFSEPDQGIYDAMNKGVQRARGKYVYFLGAGDELLPGALEAVSRHLPQNGLAFVYGNVLLDRREIYDGEFTKLRLCRQNICHQAIFFGRQLFEIVGGLDLKYKILADWAWNIKCFGNDQVEIRFMPVAVANFELGGTSRNADEAFYADMGAMTRRYLGEDVSRQAMEQGGLTEEQRILDSVVRRYSLAFDRQTKELRNPTLTGTSVFSLRMECASAAAHAWKQARMNGGSKAGSTFNMWAEWKSLVSRRPGIQVLAQLGRVVNRLRRKNSRAEKA